DYLPHINQYSFPTRRSSDLLQFRIVNRRSNNLIDLNAQLLLMTVDRANGTLQRKYSRLELEREHVLFFPLTWTIVHPIEEKSPRSEEQTSEFQSPCNIVCRF